ncbi:MAG TPA: helix-turn-helix domain-containing protein [Verrucomicrobiae bacterium]|nr:helix-turn-helix domain-containing protein [Verrucomicrobiae bacterium]
MPRKTKNEIEFDAEELIRRLEGVAKHVSGGKRLTMRTTRLALPPREKSIKPREIAELRKRLGVSQAVFAALLNVPKPTAISWESGQREPSGAALKLLRIAARHPELLAA